MKPTITGNKADQTAILYVEDNRDNRLLVRRVLEADNYRVLEAADAFQGFEVAQTAQPDLILMDINLPDMDGYEATTRMRAMKGLRNIPIVALTANVMRGDREKTLAAGCAGYIQKPIDVDRLADQLAAFLQH